MHVSRNWHVIVFLGDSCSGKGAICERLVHGSFKESADVLPASATYDVPISQFMKGEAGRWKDALKIEKLSDGPILADRWKNENEFWASVDAVVIVVSLKQQSSESGVKRWKEYIHEKRRSAKSEQKVPVAVVATGLDIPLSERITAVSAVQSSAKILGYPYFGVSCKTGEGVLRLFEELVLGLEPERRLEVADRRGAAVAKKDTKTTAAEYPQKPTADSVATENTPGQSSSKVAATAQLFGGQTSPRPTTIVKKPAGPLKISPNEPISVAAPLAAESPVDPSASNSGSESPTIASLGRARSNNLSNRVPIIISSSPDHAADSDEIGYPREPQVTRPHIGIGPLTPAIPITKDSSLSDSLSDHSGSSSPTQYSPRSDHSDDSYLSPHRQITKGATGGAASANRRALLTRSVTLAPRQTTPNLARSDARRSLKLNDSAVTARAATTDVEISPLSRKSHSKPDSINVRLDTKSPDKFQKMLKGEGGTLRLTDRPTRVPTKIEFQKEANFESKKRLMILSGAHLFIYKTNDDRKKLVETIDITSATTKRPKQSDFKLQLILASGTVRRVKFYDEGTVALFRAKIQEHSKAKTLRPGPAMAPKPSAVFVSGADALELLRSNVDNHRCADCDQSAPIFASTNLAVLVCEDCAKIHEQLPNSVSRIVQIKKISWNPYLIEMMLWMSNAVANMIWEERLVVSEEECIAAGLPPKPEPVSSDAAKRAFIEAKYIRRSYLEPNYLASMLNLDDDLPNRAMNVAIKIATLTPKHFPALVKFICHQISPDSVIDSVSLLATACVSGNCIAAIYLLENGADPNLKDTHGALPLDYADRFDQEVFTVLEDEFKTPSEVLVTRHLASNDDDSSSEETTQTFVDWPSPSKTILLNYGAEARTSPIPLLPLNKADSNEWGSLRASANSLKAAHLLGLMESPGRSSMSGSLRGSSSGFSSSDSFSPRASMFGVSSYNSLTSSNNPSPRSPHAYHSQSLRSSKVTVPTIPTVLPSSPNVVHFSDDYLESHQLNQPPTTPKQGSSTPGAWATALISPSSSPPPQDVLLSLSEPANSRTPLSSVQWRTSKHSIGKETKHGVSIGHPSPSSTSSASPLSLTESYSPSAALTHEGTQNPMSLELPEFSIDSDLCLSGSEQVNLDIFDPIEIERRNSMAKMVPKATSDANPKSDAHSTPT